MEARKNSADVVIIGGGIIGASIAFHLARKNVRVILLEKGHMASGSSGACDGTVLLQTKKPGVHLKLAMASRQKFDWLKEQLPINIEYKRCGGLVVIENEEEYEALHRVVHKQQQSGLDVTLLDANQVKEAEPHLSDNVVGAAYCALDGKVNPIALTLGFILAAQQMGVKIFPDTRVTGIEVKAGRVQAVRTETQRFEADVVVNAAGVHAPDIGEMVKLQIPIKPRRGQLLVTEPVPPILKGCLISAKYIAAKFNPDAAKNSGEGAVMEQAVNGNLFLGSTREFVGFDKRTTLEGMQRIATQAAGILPHLRHMKMIRSFAGLRPYTPDGYPILGPVENIEGMIMAAGHEGDGIALSPITGELIAQLIIDGQTDIPLSDFKLERFDPYCGKDKRK